MFKPRKIFAKLLSRYRIVIRTLQSGGSCSLRRAAKTIGFAGLVSVAAIGVSGLRTAHAEAELAPSSAVQVLRPVDGSKLDAELAAKLPGFKNGYADVNGIRIHYVEGGTGDPLVLLPGWPQTWWAYHKIMPALADRYRVIAVDLRGMGGSSKPLDGYDKKTMASDVKALADQLGLKQLNIAGHDIGSMVAYSFAANYPSAVKKLAMLDVPHVFDAFKQIPMLPSEDAFKKPNPNYYTWWFALNSVPGLPQQMLEGRFRFLQNWVMDYLSVNPAKIDAFDREAYAIAYAGSDAIRSSNAWFQTWNQDIKDLADYPVLNMPVLGLASISYDLLNAFLPGRASNVKMVKLENVGHFFPEEDPEATIRNFMDFF
ncbi:alpha/beta fold hydrolase [Paenibacillus sacheonensis]|uniref:Alpha/beta fold hydrolase n=1 Tax=Paenibacillus sacheonensis TaxID=742054 RepID=A0A7X5C2J6_9BACL|nr:alpha/beta hydrolase [Paenibacillus sacheonensis]MBM7566237.1 pimeloyl-ACP methyl ester carboxylesterase [Paenibacillus sacheonensis]NBC70444.1 alpha/beta fold hydrolase [Paenibacillus sacheonensis]